MPRLTFPDEFFLGEKRCGFYVEPLMKRAWAAQLEVLATVNDICKRHGLKYFADFGTVLGAVRHNGFIPWDDDIDITMPRKDLMLFLRYAKLELPETYKVITCHDYVEYDTIIVRLVNTNSILVEENFLREFHGFPFACGLDIFPLDYIPADPDERELQKELFNLVSGVKSAFLSGSDADEEQKSYLLSQVEQITGRPVDRNGNIPNQMAILEDALSAMYEKKDANAVGIPYRITYMGDAAIHPIEEYSDVVWHDFEVTQVPLPIGYEGYLKRQYGEKYMEYAIYPAHDYPFYRKQMDTLKKHLAAQGATIADIGLPDIERTDFADYQR
ncbi:MAG: LicD family protein [Lachnospiraceae bacterium]|nr:LicD family protein [Lachnospiraceae bacterium]